MNIILTNKKILTYCIWVKTSLPIKDGFYLNTIFHDGIDYAKFYVTSGKNKQQNFLGIYSAIGV